MFTHAQTYIHTYIHIQTHTHAYIHTYIITYIHTGKLRKETVVQISTRSNMLSRVLPTHAQLYALIPRHDPDNSHPKIKRLLAETVSWFRA